MRRRRGILVHANLGTLFGGFILLLVLICVAVPRVVAPGDPNALDLAARLLGPGAPGHVLGTDPLGHDVYRLIVAGARLSILVALTAVVVSCAIGVTLGLVTGYYGGVLDAVIMRWTDVPLLAGIVVRFRSVPLPRRGPGRSRSGRAIPLRGAQQFTHEPRSACRHRLHRQL